VVVFFNIHVRRRLTAALGIPIATAEREAADAQGSVGFLFHENRNQDGDPSTKAFGVSNRHVFREEIKGTYEFRVAAHLASTFDLTDSLASRGASTRSRSPSGTAVCSPTRDDQVGRRIEISPREVKSTVNPGA
jgi:hypothetical protein